MEGWGKVEDISSLQEKNDLPQPLLWNWIAGCILGGESDH